MYFSEKYIRSFLAAPSLQTYLFVEMELDQNDYRFAVDRDFEDIAVSSLYS